METTENNWKKKPSPPYHQPKPMQATTSSNSTPQRPFQVLAPPHPLRHNNKTITTYQNNCLSMQELKLAAIAISLNVRLRTSDMPVSMQEHAMRFSRSLMVAGKSGATSPQPQPLTPTLLARSLKKEFDRLYGPVWHCVVGKSFGSFVTHSPGGFVYFSLDSLSFLLFKTEVQVLS